MIKYNLIVADPPYSFSDRLTMSDVKRGAESNYNVLSGQNIIDLDVKSIVADDAVLALWVPSSMLLLGLNIMESWGFEQTQTFIWVKTKKKENVFKDLKSEIKSIIKNGIGSYIDKNNYDVYNDISELLDVFDLNDVLSFLMGRLFRSSHELVLIGKRGKPYGALNNKSQRSVLFAEPGKHSAKPEGLQDRLELMFPAGNKLELFARRQRPKWWCVGNEAPMTAGMDIRDALSGLKNLPEQDVALLNGWIGGL
jgi:N6-adenosine-specific RNA methylase IME4